LRYVRWLILALLLAGGLAAALIGCRPKEQLGPVFRPSFTESKFVDLAGDPEADLVAGLVKLGVLEYNEGLFQPEAPVDRGTYVTWLVRAWNIYYRDKPQKWIRLAKVAPGVTWTYGDVMPHTPLYPYLQGMIDAGLPVGFEKGEWSYSRNLKRMELVLLRNGVVMGRDKVWAPEEELDEYRVQLRTYIRDADAIPDEYLPAVYYDIADREGGEAIRLAFKDVNLADREHKSPFRPAKLVTHREAVLSLSKLGMVNYRGASVKALGEWQPLSKEEQEALQAKIEAERKSVSAGHHHEHEHEE